MGKGRLTSKGKSSRGWEISPIPRTEFMSESRILRRALSHFLCSSWCFPSQSVIHRTGLESSVHLVSVLSLILMKNREHFLVFLSFSFKYSVHLVNVFQSVCLSQTKQNQKHSPYLFWGTFLKQKCKTTDKLHKKEGRVLNGIFCNVFFS